MQDNLLLCYPQPGHSGETAFCRRCKSAVFQMSLRVEFIIFRLRKALVSAGKRQFQRIFAAFDGRRDIYFIRIPKKLSQDLPVYCDTDHVGCGDFQYDMLCLVQGKGGRIGAFSGVVRIPLFCPNVRQNASVFLYQRCILRKAEIPSEEGHGHGMGAMPRGNPCSKDQFVFAGFDKRGFLYHRFRKVRLSALTVATL